MIVVHLVPFFTLDHPMLLTLFAFVGVPVNAAVALFIDDSLLVLVLLSSFAYLVVMRIVVRLDEFKPSLLTKLRLVLTEGGWISCSA